jgi:polyhydroxyalkanoate synthesis regulator phasin
MSYPLDDGRFPGFPGRRRSTGAESSESLRAELEEMIDTLRQRVTALETQIVPRTLEEEPAPDDGVQGDMRMWRKGKNMRISFRFRNRWVHFKAEELEELAARVDKVEGRLSALESEEG